MRTPTLSGRTNVKNEPTRPAQHIVGNVTTSVSADVVVEAVVFVLVGARLADIGVIILAVLASQHVKVRQ